MKITIEESNGQIEVFLPAFNMLLFLSFIDEGDNYQVKTMSTRIDGKLKRISKKMQPIELIGTNTMEKKMSVKLAVSNWIRQNILPELVMKVRTKIQQLNQICEDLDCEYMAKLTEILDKELIEQCEEDEIRVKPTTYDKQPV